MLPQETTRARVLLRHARVFKKDIRRDARVAEVCAVRLRVDKCCGAPVVPVEEPDPSGIETVRPLRQQQPPSTFDLPDFPVRCDEYVAYPARPRIGTRCALAILHRFGELPAPPVQPREAPKCRSVVGTQLQRAEKQSLRLARVAT